MDESIKLLSSIPYILRSTKKVAQHSRAAHKLALLNSRCQFHQHFTCSFLYKKCYALLFSWYSLALNFFGKRILAQIMLVKCWWNWLQPSHIHFWWRRWPYHFSWPQRIETNNFNGRLYLKLFNYFCWKQSTSTES